MDTQDEQEWNGPLVDVAVIVVTWNSADVIVDCLDSIPVAAEGLRLQVVVVDNASSDDTIQLARAHPTAPRVVQVGRNAGYAAGLNAGMAVVVADSYLACNPDVRLAPGAVVSLRRALRSPPVGIAVPRLVDSEGAFVPSLRREPSIVRALTEALVGGRRAGVLWRMGEVVRDEEVYALPQRPAWASGAVMLVSRRCWQAVGDWDESFFLYSEETDFALRAADAGYVVQYEPAATAVHIGGELHRSPRLWSLQAVNRVRLYRKRHGRVASAAFWLAVCLNESVRAFGAGADVRRSALRSLLGTAPWRIAGRAPVVGPAEASAMLAAGSPGTRRDSCP